VLIAQNVGRGKGVLVEEEAGVAALKHDGEALEEVPHGGATLISGVACAVGRHLKENNE
jgi:hypothetical protein